MMLKKIALLLTLSVSGLAVGSISNAAPKTKFGVTVTECNFDYENEKFCTDSRLKSYAKAMKDRKANFDGNKIIYIFQTNATGYVGKKPDRLVVIDTAKKTVSPFGYALSDATDGSKNVAVNKKGNTKHYDFNKSSNRFCFSGNIDAYRMSESYDGTPFCFKYDNREKQLIKEF